MVVETYTSINRRKQIFFHEKASKDFKKFPKDVKKKFLKLIEILSREGRLFEPEAKKLDKNLYELRVYRLGAWRGIYAYLNENKIIILNVFQKKSQKTPEKELRTSYMRLRQFIN